MAQTGRLSYQSPSSLFHSIHHYKFILTICVATFTCFSLRPCPLSSSLCEEEPFPKPMLSIQDLEILYSSRWALLEFQKKDMDKQYFHRISVIDEDSNCEVVDSPKAPNSRACRAFGNVSLKRSIF